jgi:hypothetical protein
MNAALQVLVLVNAVAQRIGSTLVSGIGFVLPVATIPLDLATPVGWLALVTAGLLIAEVARKVTWVVVGIGWLLVVVRIVAVTLPS